MVDIQTGQKWRHRETGLEVKLVIYSWQPSGRTVSIMAVGGADIVSITEKELLAQYEYIPAEVS